MAPICRARRRWARWCGACSPPVPELKRLRLSSLDPVEIDDDLLRADRRGTAADAAPASVDPVRRRSHPQAHEKAPFARRRHRCCARGCAALRPDVAFGADLIAGFPTETDDMFDNTMALVEECDIAYLHVFPYSERAGTPAARMPQVPVQARRERAARLRALGERRLNRISFRICAGQGVGAGGEATARAQRALRPDPARPRRGARQRRSGPDRGARQRRVEWHDFSPGFVRGSAAPPPSSAKASARSSPSAGSTTPRSRSWKSC